jgi:hypothetical protein
MSATTTTAAAPTAPTALDVRDEVLAQVKLPITYQQLFDNRWRTNGAVRSLIKTVDDIVSVETEIANLAQTLIGRIERSVASMAHHQHLNSLGELQRTAPDFDTAIMRREWLFDQLTVLATGFRASLTPAAGQ